MATRVLVLGLAATGEAVVRHFASTDAVTVMDDRLDAPALAARAAQLHATTAPDATPDELVAAHDLVVPSPGVPPTHPVLVAAARIGVPVRSEIDLAADELRAPLVAITGTNGKTTVTMLVTAILEQSGLRAVAAGNIGRPLLDLVGDDDGVDIVVAEVSSFQLEFTTTFRPQVAVLLSLAPDHLDWHGSFDAYAAAKAKIFSRQQPADVLVANRDDHDVAALAAIAPGAVRWYSITDAEDGYRLAGDALVDEEGTEIITLDALHPQAPHDVSNALAATAAARAAGGSVAAAAAVLREPPRAAHRLAKIATVDGVAYFDDSKATNPHATASAVSGFEHVVLIAGGRNKGLDLTPLRSLALRIDAVIAIGDAAADVDAAFRGAVPVEFAASMRDAVRAAARHASRGGVVLLSPACASFDWYTDYGARGDDFIQEVLTLADRTEVS
jgi:UDP-N-acetylmuramoylalanine--D-glutamate ligase